MKAESPGWSDDLDPQGEPWSSLTVADSPVAPMDLDVFPRTWYPSLDVFPDAFISFSATSWQSILSLTPVEETKMWSFGKKRRRKWILRLL